MHQRLLVCGVASSGKTYSLKGLRDHEKVLFLNCEASKGMILPFKNKFKKKVITSPLGELVGEGSVFRAVAQKPDSFNTIVIDSMTFLMDLFETKYVNTATNTMGAWGAYGDFINQLCNVEIATLPQDIIFTAHVAGTYNGDSLMENKIPIKGNIGKKGFEAFFNNIVYVKTKTLEELEPYKNKYLNITETDKLLGFKHVIQTRLTKDSIHDKIRGADDLWDISETFIDGNIQHVLDRLNEYYGV